MYDNTASIRHEVTGLRRDAARLRKEVAHLRGERDALREERDELLAKNRKLHRELNATETVVTLLSTMLILAVEEG